MSIYYNLYKNKIFWNFLKIFNIKSIMDVPQLIKIVLNLGCGDFFNDKKKLQKSYDDLFLISNQKPIFIKSKKSISNFKLRKGSNISIKVTLRNFLMYEFLYKFINIAVPSIKDFIGFNIKNFDNSGNFNFGIKDQIIFPEIVYDSFIKGLNLSFIIKNSDINKSLFLLKNFNFPFKN
ncbi:50S ribosomal protein L5p (L11e) [Candidatus Nasuia deltocephalinicola]|nr:50S ribosomal protein L5p (L11e) [Candidatus Nasuia deltocephalinicola]